MTAYTKTSARVLGFQWVILSTFHSNLKPSHFWGHHTVLLRETFHCSHRSEVVTLHLLTLQGSASQWKQWQDGDPSWSRDVLLWPQNTFHMFSPIHLTFLKARVFVYIFVVAGPGQQLWYTIFKNKVIFWLRVNFVEQGWWHHDNILNMQDVILVSRV